MKAFTPRALAVLAALCPMVVRAVTPPPANDKFANATELSGTIDTLNNQTCAGATPEALDPFVGAVKMTQTVWYRFDAASSTQKAHVVVAHPAGGAIVGVFFQQEPDGNAGTLSAVPNGSVNDGGTGTDTLTFSMAKFNRFYICAQVPVGQFSITLMQPGQNNDFFQDAITLPGNKGAVTGSTSGCSNVNDKPAVTLPNPPSNGVWYSWAPTFTGTAVVDTNFSFSSPGQIHNTNIVILTGSTLAGLALVASDTNSGYTGGTFGANSRVTFAATSGTTYTIWVGDNLSGSGSFNLEYFQNTEPGVFELVADFTQLSPSQGPVPAEVRRHFAGAVAVNVTAMTVAGTALANTDYVPVNAVLAFPAGGSGSAALSRIVYVNAVPDPQVLGSRTLAFALASATNGSTLLNNSQSDTVTINYSNVVAPGFATATMQVSKRAGSIQIPLQRADSSGEAIVTITAGQAGDTAVDGVDYSFYTNTLYFYAGQSLAYLDVPIFDNGKPDGNRSFTLGVTPHINQQVMDGARSLKVTIIDDVPPAPAACQFSTFVGDPGGLFGVVSVKVAAGGAFTGKLVTNRATYPLAGKLSATGYYSVTVGPAGATRTLELQITDSTTNTYEVALLDNVGASQQDSTIVTATIYSKASPCPQAGLYTFADGGTGTATKYGTAAIAVSTAGIATIAGKVFDGTAFTASVGVNQYNVPGFGLFGVVTAGQTLYNGSGSIVLSLYIEAGVISPIASLRLIRPGRASLPMGTLTELAAVDANASCTVAPYSPQGAASRALLQWNISSTGMATFHGAGYAVPVVQMFGVGTANKITLPPAVLVPHLTLAFNNATGVYTGTLTPPGTAKPRPISGVVIQQGNQSYAPGLFLNPADLSSVGTVVVQ